MSEACSIELGDDGCARLAGELTFEAVPALYAQTQNSLPEQLQTVDLSGITTADSAGLALLLEWQAARQDTSGTLSFTHAPSSLMSLASLCEATGLLNISGRE